ncbi:MAG TPA: DUF1569 domain-containing protein [Cyclobacteriaceae bacterium]
MKTIFDKTVREELVNRFNSLDESKTAQWGKMNVYQMVKHCTIWNEWVLGTNRTKYKQEFLGVIFGKMAMNHSIKDDRPLQKNVPAGKDLMVKEKTGDLEYQKKSCIDRIAQYETYSNPNFIHDFFGKMTEEQIGIFVYKHMDHHLRQFNV